VTESDPVGALAEEHLAAPELKVALHMVRVPILKVTVPEGVPEEDVTVALYLTA